jgi:signal transduction histidine kinase
MDNTLQKMNTPVTSGFVRPSEQAFSRILEEITGELQLRPLLTNIIRHVCGLLQADDGAIALYDRRRHILHVEATMQLPESELGAEYEPGEGLMGRVLETGQPVLADRYGELPRISLPELSGNSVIGVPILARGGLIGVFGIGAHPPRRFTSDDLETLQVFACHAALAIQNALRYTGEQRRTERMALISRVSQLGTMGLEPEQLVANAAQVIHERLNYPHVVIPLMHAGEPDYLLFRAHAGAYRDAFEAPYQLPVTQGVTGAAVTQRRVQLVNDVREDPRYVAPPVPIKVRSELAVPIVLGEEVFGCINIEGLHPFDDDDVASVQIIADHLAVAIKNSRLSSEARQAAVMRERQRLARDLHDAVSQALSSISLMSQSLVTAWRRDPAEGERRAHRLEELARLAFAEMRALLRELRPTSNGMHSPTSAGSDDVRNLGLKAALQRFASMVAPQTPSIRLDFAAYRPQAPTLEEGLYLICREALSNSIRHSSAPRVDVHAVAATDELVITVADNGAGFDPRLLDIRSDLTEHGIGLHTMRERAESLGAVCEIRSQPGQGTCVCIRMSLPAREGTV